MALTITGIKSRMDREFKMLGLISSKDDAKTDIISDALSAFCDMMDEPIINAELAVVSSTTRYTIPATIRKITDIRNSDKASVVYDEDELRGEIVLQDTPSADTHVVYGTPEDTRTNISTIIAAVKTQYETVLWSYIRWSAFEYYHHKNAANELLKAEKMAKRARASRNRRLDNLTNTVQTIDTTGQKIADIQNKENFDVSIPGLFEGDL